MIILFVRIVLAVLAICFAGWIAYIVSLGLKSFFSNGKMINDINSDKK